VKTSGEAFGRRGEARRRLKLSGEELTYMVGLGEQ